jgi:hypothetical protein
VAPTTTTSDAQTNTAWATAADADATFCAETRSVAGPSAPVAGNSVTTVVWQGRRGSTGLVLAVLVEPPGDPDEEGSTDPFPAQLAATSAIRMRRRRKNPPQVGAGEYLRPLDCRST